MDADLELLTGPEAGGLLAAAVASVGGELVDWGANQVDHRPGRSTTVAYVARVRWADREQVETLAASVGAWDSRGAPEGVLVLGDGQREVAVWRFPVDPSLPALAGACDPGRVAGLLAQLGVVGVDPGGVDLRVRSYRPRRRAVIEVRAGAARVFLKVGRAGSAAGLYERHALLHSAGVPVPEALAWTDDGLLVLQGLPGSSMREALRGGGPVPRGRDFLDLLEGLPTAVMDLPRRSAWADGADHYAAVLAAVVPDQAGLVADLAGSIRAGLAGQVPDAPTHGDFYEAQILLEGDRISGLLDVDSAGPGRRADDIACLLAHVELLAVAGLGPAEELTAVRTRWQEAAEQVLDPGELRLRTAGVLLSLATGPHRVQDPGWPRATRLRIHAVRRWVDSAAGWVGGSGEVDPG